MNPNEFITALRRLKEPKWGWRLFEGNIRAFPKTEFVGAPTVCCPVTAVAFALTGKKFSTIRPTRAGAHIGIRETALDIIVAAADNDRECGFSYRNQARHFRLMMLEALGL